MLLDIGYRKLGVSPDRTLHIITWRTQWWENSVKTAVGCLHTVTLSVGQCGRVLCTQPLKNIDLLDLKRVDIFVNNLSGLLTAAR